jgi:hypothetical protein
MDGRSPLSWAPPARFLFFTAAAFAELLTGVSPPVRFFHPVGLTLLTLLYGGGVLLARETMQRWGKGWPTLFWLGVAYGLAEEGLAVKSFFDPDWQDLNHFKDYGRWGGVNWVWSLHVTQFHALFSVLVNVTLTDLIFPDWSHRRWLNDRAFRRVGWMFGAVVLAIHLLFPYRPPLALVFACALVLAVCVQIARAQPGSWSGPAVMPPGPPGIFFRGLMLPFLFFVVPGFAISRDWPVAFTIIAVVGIMILVGRRIAAWARHERWSAMHRFSLTAGAIAFFIPLTRVHANSAARDGRGMTLVGLAAAGLLFWAFRRIRAAPPADARR